MWLDLPRSATVPVYKEKVFVKALRLPDSLISFSHKQELVYATDATKNKQSKNYK